MNLTDWTLAFMEDPSGRRGIWYRKVRGLNGISLEICGGREGDDHYLCLHPNSPVSVGELEQLIDCLNTQSWVRQEKMHAETCERKADPVVAELLKELEQTSQANTDLWDRVRSQQVTINDLLRALSEKPELARYAVVERLRSENLRLTSKNEKQAEEIAALKRALTKRAADTERAEGER